MFTGLIQDVGKVLNISNNTIKVNTMLEKIKIGESISVNGVCLTVINIDSQVFSADISPETLSITNLCKISGGEAVNLERSLTPNSLMGGHIVTGHIDNTGIIKSISKDKEFYRFTVELTDGIEKYIVSKGSIAVDGISLTAAKLNGNSVELWIIPETYSSTNMKYKKAGSIVNIETDIIAKHIEKLIRKGGNTDSVSFDLLKKEGFL